MSCFAADRVTRRAAAAVATLALAAQLAGCSAGGATPVAPENRYLLTASGRLDSRTEARALAADHDGIIAQMLVERDAEVAAGQPLVRLACEEQQAALAASSAEAAAAAAQARLVAAGPRSEERAAARARANEAAARDSDARDQLARAEALTARGFVSNRRIEELRAEAAARRAQLLAVEAEAQIADHGSRPDERRKAEAVARAAAATEAARAAVYHKCALRSPIAGTIVQILKREGEFSAASSGAPIVVVADLRAMIVRAEIADMDAARAHTGQFAEIWIDGDARRWRGRITQISSQMGRKTARSLDPSDRFDRDIREAIISFEGAQPPRIVGLRVNVGILA